MPQVPDTAADLQARIQTRIEDVRVRHSANKRRRSLRRTQKQEIAERRGIVRTRRATVVRIVLIVLAAALLFTPILLVANPICYLPFVAGVLLVIVSFIYLQVLKRSLTMELDIGGDSTLARGEASVLSVHLSNSCPLPYPRIELEFYVTDLFGDYDDVRPITCALGAHETASADFEVSFAHLGTYEAGVSRVRIHDLIGLFSSMLDRGISRPVTVHPRSVDLGPGDAFRAEPDESRSSLRPVAADDMDYSSVREYRYGDSLKSIHWNLSARDPRGTLYTRVYEAYVNPSLVIVLDTISPEYANEELMSLFDGMVECAAALCVEARAGGIDAEVRYVDRDGLEAASHLANTMDADDMVTRMRRITPEGEGPHPEVEAATAEEMLRTAGLQSHGFSNVVLVGARTDPGQLRVLTEIASMRRRASAYIAAPRMLEGKERERFLSPLHALEASGAVWRVVESDEHRTEVVNR